MDITTNDLILLGLILGYAATAGLLFIQNRRLEKLHNIIDPQQGNDDADENNAP